MMRRFLLAAALAAAACGLAAAEGAAPKQSGDAARVVIRSRDIKLGSFRVLVDGAKALDFLIMGEYAAIDLEPGAHVINVYPVIAEKLVKTIDYYDLGLDVPKGGTEYVSVLENRGVMYLQLEPKEKAEKAIASKTAKYLDLSAEGGAR